jgi:hypothetical protein
MDNCAPEGVNIELSLNIQLLPAWRKPHSLIHLLCRNEY